MFAVVVTIIFRSCRSSKALALGYVIVPDIEVKVSLKCNGQ